MSKTKLNSILLHIRYPYTAIVIAIMWIGMAIIITSQQIEAYEILLAATAVATLIIAVIGFRQMK